jgi:hypothetical protein
VEIIAALGGTGVALHERACRRRSGSCAASRQTLGLYLLPAPHRHRAARQLREAFQAAIRLQASQLLATRDHAVLRGARDQGIS